MSESPDTEYTPTTEDVIRAYRLPATVTNPRRPDESFADWLSRISIEGHINQIASERAARRWLAAHDREVAAKAEEWGHDLEAVLVETYTILKPLGEGTHAPDSPILKALAVLGEQDFTGKRLERDREVAAKALEDAANWMQLGIGEPWNPDDEELLRKHWSARRKYLYDRAAHIREGDE